MIKEVEEKLLKNTIDDIKVIDFAMSGVCVLFIATLLTMGNPKGSLEFALWSFSFAIGCFGIGIRILYQQKNGLGKGNKRLSYGCIILCNIGEICTGIGLLLILWHMNHWTWLWITIPIFILALCANIGTRSKEHEKLPTV
jgi:hypothetical protein